MIAGSAEAGERVPVIRFDAGGASQSTGGASLTGSRDTYELGTEETYELPSLGTVREAA